MEEKIGTYKEAEKLLAEIKKEQRDRRQKENYVEEEIKANKEANEFFAQFGAKTVSYKKFTDRKYRGGKNDN